MGFGETLGRTGTGAATGFAVGGPVGGVIGGGLGLLTSLFSGGSSEALQAELRRQADEMARLRPLYAQAGEQGLQQQLGALGPANQMLGQMYGMGQGQGPINLQALGQSPLPSDVFGQPVQQAPPPGGVPANMRFRGVL